MQERDVEKRLVRGVRNQGGLCLKWVSPGFAGVPDRIVLLPGERLFFIELKQETGRLTKLQRWVHGKLRDLGFPVITLYGPGDVELFLDFLKKRGDPHDL